MRQVEYYNFKQLSKLRSNVDLFLPNWGKSQKVINFKLGLLYNWTDTKASAMGWHICVAITIKEQKYTYVQN